MNEKRGTLERLAGELVKLLSPLTSLTPDAAPAFLLELGLPLQPAQVTAIQPALGNTVLAVSALIDAQFALEVSIDTEGADVIGSRVTALNRIADVITSFQQLQTALGGLGLPGGGAIVADLPRRLFNLLLSRYLARSAAVSELLQLTGVLVRKDFNIGSFDPVAPFFTVDDFNFGRIGGWLSDPSMQLAELFDWNVPGFDGRKILGLFDRILGEAGLPVLYDPSAAAPELDMLVLKMAPRLDAPAGIELSFEQGLTPGKISLERSLWTLDVSLDTNLLPGTRLVLRPGALGIEPPDATTAAGRISANYTYKAEAPITLLSFAGLASVTVEEIGGTAELRFSADRSASFLLGAELRRGKLKIGVGEADGFIKTILGGLQLESHFDLGLGYSLAGLRFNGSSSLEIQMPAHASAGPVEIKEVALSIGIKGSTFPVGITADMRAALGPLISVIQGIGFEAAISLVDDRKGNLGALDIRPGFRPPRGIGLSLDAGGFKGGGFLQFDSEKGEYAGVLELEFQGIVTVKAIGLLNTRMPNGRDGFSLLILICAEFIPIQLGFGFTLIGVGGLLGLNRTVVYDVLRAGVRDGSLNSVMFPKDVVANAPRIIADLGRIFPPMEDRFLIGPMAKLGWGTPTILSLELGILLEIPRPAFAILGVLRASLPAEDLPLVHIQVNFLGVVDFETCQLSFDASLYDSKILFITLTGDMALRLYWGENANFLLSVGGFHPAYTPPPMGLGQMKRLGMEIFTGMPRIRAEAYFAVTSNTVQFGARVEMLAGIDLFNVYGFMAFDALVQFSPFHFITEFAAMLAVRSGESELMGIRVEAMLEGPSAWHARGTGTFRIGFIIKISLSIDFDITIGDERKEKLPALDLMPRISEALQQSGNWRAVIPTGSRLTVTLREIPEDDAVIILHPFGSLEVTQKIAPLNLPLDRFGAQGLEGGHRYHISELKFGDDVVPVDNTREQFAPAQFLNLSDADKLSRRSFERYDAGVRAGGGQRPVADYQSALDVLYEVIYLPETRRSRFLYGLDKMLFEQLTLGGHAAQSAMAAQKAAPSGLGTPKVAMPSEQYAITSTSDLTLHGSGAIYASQAEAHAGMSSLMAANPEFIEQLQVVPLYQVNRS